MIVKNTTTAIQEEVDFLQAGEDVFKTNNQGRSDCFNYGSTDHWVDQCPDITEEKNYRLKRNVKSINMETGTMNKSSRKWPQVMPKMDFQCWSAEKIRSPRTKPPCTKTGF